LSEPMLAARVPAEMEDFFLTRTPERRICFALLMLMAALYIPFAGNYGLWDPWETHYSEVARQMLQRHDFVSLWWPGSPQDRNEFWSKPVLTFWLMALGMAMTGLPRSGVQFDGEMAVGWTAEWSVRIPFILCGIACAWATWEMTRRLAGRRAALWATISLATGAQFFFITRQAMTDMAFVAPMAVALCYAGLAFMLPSAETEAELPRADLGPLNWPHAPIFYFLLASAIACIVPQLVICSIQAPLSFTIGHKAVKMAGVVGMLPWIACFVGWLAFAGRHTRNKKQIYLQIAFLMCGLSTLAKGPAGVALPAIVLFVYLLVTGDLMQLVRSIGPIVLGIVLFVACSFPWYHAMLIRHGIGFWNEFIGDNYVHRAAGRHGDRGTFEYYLLQIGHGMYPWTGFVGASIVSSLAKLGGADRDGRARLRIFAFVWLLVMFTTMSLVNTKFHHYILPGLPALAILIGLYIDDLVTAPSTADALALLVIGVPLLALSARDLAMFPARLLWLFDYDYVNAPNGGRPWPPGAEYDYGARLAGWGIATTAATAWFAVTALVRALLKHKQTEDDDANPPSLFVWLTLPLAILTVVFAQLWQPKFGTHPSPLANGWILVGLAGLLGVGLIVGRGLARFSTVMTTVSLLVVAGVACLWTGWGLDRLLTDVSPHWSQKHVIASYYQQRQNEKEPLIAWQMYWRGENFYTKNAIYDHRIEQRDKTVFLGDHNAEKLQEYLRTHTGHRVFFIVERSRFEALRALLPEANRPSLKAVDESNNKVYLAVANN